MLPGLSIKQRHVSQIQNEKIAPSSDATLSPFNPVSRQSRIIQGYSTIIRALNFMNTTPNGKISRLPAPIREQVNLRLSDGHSGKQIVAWLNSLPEVRSVMAELYDGRPIVEGNLSEWRNRSYQDWLLAQDILALAGRSPVKTGASSQSI